MALTDINLFLARDVMTTDVVTVRPDTSIQEAADLFEAHQVSGLPVVDRQQRLLGILTEYDLLQSINPLQMRGTVADFMTTDVVTVDEDTALFALTETFLATRLRRIPVTCQGKLIGVISRRDLIFAGKIRQQLLGELPALSAAE